MDQTTTPNAVQGDQRPQAIALAYLTAGAALDLTLQRLQPIAEGYHGTTQRARSIANRAILDTIEAFEGDTGEELHPVVARLAEALVTVELRLLPAGASSRQIVDQLETGMQELNEIGEANV